MPKPSQRLSPAELADAAVLADLAVLVVVLARLTPLAGLTTVFGAIPFAVLGLRNRTRVVILGFWIAVVLTFLLAGFNAATQVLVMATFGGVIGRAFAQGWGRGRTVAVAIGVGWTTVASLTLAFLWTFDGLRELNLDAARVQWTGISRGLDAIGLKPVVAFVDPRFDAILDYWWVSVPIFQLAISVFLTGFVVRVGRPVISRVQRAFGQVPPPSADIAALADRIGRHRGLTVVTGPNGAGKTTLLRAMVDRSSDRGRRGGVAVIGQRPESQVIGTRVIDDLAWGLDPPPSAAESEHALDLVGLGAFGDRETGSLSGGELQRLALAAAVVRRPTMLLSDESTAMIDPDGRRIVLSVLRRLADDEVKVVHVSHLDGDLAAADQVVEL